jgi:hypothetical protein
MEVKKALEYSQPVFSFRFIHLKNYSSPFSPLQTKKRILDIKHSNSPFVGSPFSSIYLL